MSAAPAAPRAEEEAACDLDLPLEDEEGTVPDARAAWVVASVVVVLSALVYATRRR